MDTVREMVKDARWREHALSGLSDGDLAIASAVCRMWETALSQLGIWDAEVVTVDSPEMDGEEYWVTESLVIRQGDRIAILRAA